MSAAHGRLSPLLRAAARLPGLRRLRHARFIERVVEAHYRGSACTRPLVYTLRECSGRHRIARYRPRGGAIDVLIRHNTSDGNILQEFAMHGLYNEPEPVASYLASLERPRVVDLGAHIGLYGAHILSRYPNAALISVEADPDNAELLRATAARSHRDWRVIEAAATTSDGAVRFACGRYAESRIDPAGVLIAAVDALELLGNCDLAKIDIEGGEWELLTDRRFEQLECVLILEWHPYRCPDEPERAATKALEQSGFAVLGVEGAPPGVGMLWAWRDALGHVSR